MPIKDTDTSLAMKPITVEDAVSLDTRISLLDSDARAGLFILLKKLVTMLENDEGCAVTFIDPLGQGDLSVLALGNQTLVNPIMHVAADLYESMTTAQEGPLQ